MVTTEWLTLLIKRVNVLIHNKSVVGAPYRRVKGKLRGNGEDAFGTWCGCQYDV